MTAITIALLATVARPGHPDGEREVDANPAEVTQTSVVPDKVGVFDVRCAELCGLLHAQMETSVHVVSRADFAAWLAQQRGPA